MNAVEQCVTCGHAAEHSGGGLGVCVAEGCGCDGPPIELVMNPAVPVVCYACKTLLEPVFDFDPDTEYQFRDALWLGFHGGYAMFVDNLDTNAIWGDPSMRVLPGGPDYEAVICGTCAENLLTASPWIERLFRGEES